MRNLTLLVMILGIIAIIMGGVFVGLGFARDNQIKQAMRAEAVGLVNLGVPGAQAGQLIDSMSEAEIAANTIKEHRRNIAASYEELLGGGRYDPTNPQHLSYTQAINLENYLYMGVLALGLTSVIMGSGAFMILTGLALVALAWAVRKLAAVPR